MLNQNKIPRVIFIYYGKEDSMENTEKTLKNYSYNVAGHGTTYSICGRYVVITPFSFVPRFGVQLSLKSD